MKISKYKDNIQMYNFEIPAQEAYKYFEISEFVVLPYKDATGSGVIPVAYSFSKPVIVTNVGELSSVVEPGETGFVIKDNKPDVLGKQIIQMLENKKESIGMGKKAFTYSENELSWEPIINQIYEK